MPLPKPKKDESHDDFMKRCMSDDVMLKEYDDEKQRYAVCQSQWDNSRDVERRVVMPEETELRIVDGDKPKIVGYAAKYGKWSLDLGGFVERVRKGAFDEAIDESDIRCLKNHDANLILGRNTSGTLRLSSNTVGLQYECDIPNTTTGKDIAEEVRRGDISGNSFSFRVAEDDWKYFEDGRVERTIIKFGQVFDLGPVVFPAYPDTTVAMRSLEAHRPKAEQRTEDEKDKSEDEPTTISPERERQVGREYEQLGRYMKHWNSKIKKDESPES